MPIVKWLIPIIGKLADNVECLHVDSVTGCYT